MHILGNSLLMIVAGVAVAVAVSFVATFGLAFIAVAAAVLWMSFVYLVVERMSDRRSAARIRLDPRDRAAS